MNLSHLFHSSANDPRPVLVIPRLSEMRQDAYRPDLRAKIAAQLEAAARQLASANFWRWDRRCMKAAIERWDEKQLCFIGLNLSDFCVAVETAFRCCTDDGAEYRLDRVIADRLWAAACRPGVLPTANFDVQLTMRREAMEQKERNATKQSTIRRTESEATIGARIR